MFFRINYFVYKPVKVSDASSGVRTRPSVRKRYVSLMNLSESDEDSDSKDLDKISRVLI